MKKILWIFLLSFFWCNFVLANHCGHDLEKKLSYSTNKNTIFWNIKNKTNKNIIITKLGVWAKDNKSVIREDTKGYDISPYAKIRLEFYIGNLNREAFGNYFSACKYGKRTLEEQLEGLGYKSEKKEKRCGDTDYETPCTCEKEPNSVKKKYCELRKKNANKMTRGDAASMCARRSEEYSKEIGAEYYKDCMKEEGF
jgi:hypothetical protein